MKKIINLDYVVYYRLLSVSNIIKTKPNEIYNLAAQSHAVSFEVPEYTANADALGALEYWKQLNFINLKKTKILSSWNFRNVRKSSKNFSK